MWFRSTRMRLFWAQRYDVSEWSLACMDVFEILKPISKGAFGRVYLSRKNDLLHHSRSLVISRGRPL